MVVKSNGTPAQAGETTVAGAMSKAEAKAAERAANGNGNGHSAATVTPAVMSQADLLAALAALRAENAALKARPAAGGGTYYAQVGEKGGIGLYGFTSRGLPIHGYANQWPLIAKFAPKVMEAAALMEQHSPNIVKTSKNDGTWSDNPFTSLDKSGRVYFDQQPDGSVTLRWEAVPAGTRKQYVPK